MPRGLIRAIVTLILTGVPAVLGAGPALAAGAAPRTAPATAAGPSLEARILANHVLTAELVLLVLANVALVLAWRRYRRGAQAGPAPDVMIGDPWMTPPPAADDYPSWPGRPGPYALHPDHPSWPGRPDPRWAATEAALREDDYPRWPEPQGPPWRDAERPADVGEPGWPGPAGPVPR